MRTLAGLLALFGLVAAGVIREKRQARCVSAFQNVPNVCLNNPAGQVFFPHATDITKFLQCDIFGRMYIIQCPETEVYNTSISGCQPSKQILLPSINTPPQIQLSSISERPQVQVPSITPSPLIQVPSITVSTASPQPVGLPNNPCSPHTVAMGQIYFPYAGDRNKFYVCGSDGAAIVMSCPRLLVWDQSILSCAYAADLLRIGVQTATPHLVAGDPDNPCKALGTGRRFYSHSTDKDKYIQCDNSGGAFINSCPASLIWHLDLETCYSPIGPY